METIGKRAAKAIRERAERNGTKLEVESLKVYVSRKVMNDWEIRNRNPSAFFLQQMALAGYDVIGILTGGNDNGKAQNVRHE